MTPTNHDLTALAERCEAATGPDRELDGEIDQLFYDRPENGDYDDSENCVWRECDGYSGLCVRGDGFARKSFCARDYTASLDAAKSLWPGEVPHLIPSDPRIATAMALRARATINKDAPDE